MSTDSRPAHENARLFDVAVVGGGAAGILAALFAARAGADAVLLEGSRACGLKILISGGGRCNVLPSSFALDDFFTRGSRNVLRRLFKTWSLEAVHEFFESDLDIALTVEEPTGKVFPAAQSARFVRDRLVEACGEAGAEMRTSRRVTAIDKTSGPESTFRLDSRDGESLIARRLVLATGGLSLPKTGSDGAGYEFARRFGHSTLDTYAALVPLTTDDAEIIELAGVSLPVRWRARLDKTIVEERTRELLFTHRGFSGPAVLDASHWFVRDGATIEVAWGAMAATEWLETLEAPTRRELSSVLADHLPRRLARFLCQRAGVPHGLRYGELNKAGRKLLLATLCEFELPVTGDEGYRAAEVTGGGVPLQEIDPSTLESRRTPGLYLCGEILDVIGRIGGHNFLWAWVTGKLAGEAAARG